MLPMEEFLKQCEQSGDSAYGALRGVLERLEDPATRKDARIFLSDLHKRVADSDDCLRRYHFQIHDIFLDQYQGLQGRKKLTMMVIPSIFIPEDWSYTFYEGLNRHPDSIFKDKTVSELGCGNGWITIAIADKWLPLKVYGLDINPRAVKVSWINLYLNALNDSGEPIYDAEKKTLLDRVEFHESDLLGYIRDHDIQLERIVGCIPQILNPNPDAMSKMITENASEEFLHSLSNYCALQGFVEDQFGLGLIARAVEEGIAVIKPMGIMIFNMGGRPGQAVCKRLFERRGFHVNKLWQTKILQAADTDISALVEIEKNSPHRFEFFMGLTGDQPICARTAWAYGMAGGRIAHALSVYSCQLRQPNQVKNIFDFLKNGFHEVSSSLDLFFEDDAVADEKIPFLAYLANELGESQSFRYEPPAGSFRFRNLIAGFMKTYHHIPLSSDNVVIFPSRSAAIENALRLFSPQLAIVDEHLTRHLPQKWLTSLAIKDPDAHALTEWEETHNRTFLRCLTFFFGIGHVKEAFEFNVSCPSLDWLLETAEANGYVQDQITVIEAPRQSDLLVELIRKLKPKVVITGMAQFEAVTTSAFVQLLDTTKEIGSRLFLDISDHFELSSLPSSNGVLKYMAGTRLPPHASVLCGLVRNKVYSDLEVAFIISEEESVFRALSKTVEVLEGSTAPIRQYYYGCLFHELLAFQLADRHPLAERECIKDSAVDLIGFNSSAVEVLKSSELSINEASNSSLIHMDVDESFLPSPACAKAAIFESFSRQNMAEPETDVTPSIKQFVMSNYGFPISSSTEFVYSDTSQALFNRLIMCCIEEGGTLCFPAGSNGNYVSAAKFLRANILNIRTELETGFKWTDKILNQALKSVKKPWVYISGPTVNPTGSIYSGKEMDSILTTCAHFGARMIIDTSFSGLEFDHEGSIGWNLASTLSKLDLSGDSSFCVSLLGGPFLNILSGALKFGYLIFNNPHLIDTFYSFPGISKPHGTVRYAIKKLLGLKEQKSGLADAIAEETRILKHRYERLKETLEKCGWEVLKSSGGVSVVAKPSAYLNKVFKIKHSPSGDDNSAAATCQGKLDDTNIREAIFKSTGLCINSGSWTGIPGYCRFSIGLDERDFKRALDCIVQFKNVLDNPA